MDGVELEKRIEQDIGRSKLYRNRNNLRILWRVGIIVLPFISAIITVTAAIIPASQAQQPHDTMWPILAAIASVVTAMFVPSLLKEYENAQRLVTTAQTCLMNLENLLLTLQLDTARKDECFKRYLEVRNQYNGVLGSLEAEEGFLGVFSNRT
jgi:hypothetical protein